MPGEDILVTLERYLGGLALKDETMFIDVKLPGHADGRVSYVVGSGVVRSHGNTYNGLRQAYTDLWSKVPRRPGTKKPETKVSGVENKLAFASVFFFFCDVRGAGCAVLFCAITI